MSLSLAPLSLPALTLQLRPLPSAVVTRFVGTMGRSDSHPGLSQSLAGTEFGGCRHRNGSPVLRHLPCRRAVATTPADPSHRIVRGFRRPFVCNGGGLPPLSAGSASTWFILEACSAFTAVTAHLLAESPARLVDVGSFSRFVTSSTVPTATGWNNQPSRTGLAPAGK
jgi:hypothetical protein